MSSHLSTFIALIVTVSVFAAEPVPLTVYEQAGLNTIRPVTGGIPLPEGVAAEGAVFILKDDAGKEIPLQTSVLAQWKEGSARWVLLDFQSSPPPNGVQHYTLNSTPNSDPSLSTVAASKCPKVSVTENALLNIADQVDVLLTMTDGEGQLCKAVIESAVANPETVSQSQRATFAVRGAFFNPDGKRMFQFRLNVSTYAGLSQIRLEPMILIDVPEGIMQHIQDLRLTLRPHNTPQQGQLGGDTGGFNAVSSPMRLFQRDDVYYEIQQSGDAVKVSTTGEKAPGWAAVKNEQCSIAVAMRSFWQQWPKAIEVSKEGLSVGLLPKFQEGAFAHMEPWYKHQYLFEGESYRLRTGQARRWEVWVDLKGDGDALAKMADAPLVLSCDPAHAIASGVWGDIYPAGSPAMAPYDAWADNLFEAYNTAIETDRDYGTMNWGDWFGERKINWGNHCCPR